MFSFGIDLHFLNFLEIQDCFDLGNSARFFSFWNVEL